MANRTRFRSGAGEPTPSPATAAENDGPLPEAEIAKLRGRWELASVLNFLNVFEAVIENDLKLTAEEIEMALVKPNTSIAKLHIILLKGIPPVSKQLDVSGAWVTALCKKLATWWPWVAEGEMLLKIANGEEVQQYKELEPTSRLVILKALCELRADQHDVVQFINDSLKNGSEISQFRKCRIGGDGNVTSYWYDGNTFLGHRLYTEVSQTGTKFKNKSSKGSIENSLLWETIATNLEEFEQAVEKLESSKLFEEVAISKTIVGEVLPAVKKFQKRKDRSLKQKEKQEQLFKSFRTYAAGMTRSCRRSRPVSYTFEEYDRAIDEAVEVELELPKKRKTLENKLNSDDPIDERNSVSNRERKSAMASVLEEGVLDNGESGKDSDPESQKDSEENSLVAKINPNQSQESPTDEKESDYEYNEEEGDDHVDDEIISESDDNDDFDDRNYPQKQAEKRRSHRLTHVNQRPAAQDMHNGARQKLRQRPTRNSAIDIVVPDSDDDFV